MKMNNLLDKRTARNRRIKTWTVPLGPRVIGPGLEIKLGSRKQTFLVARGKWNNVCVSPVPRSNFLAVQALTVHFLCV